MINRVVLVGRLTKDPEFRTTQSGTDVATFTLAVNRNFTNAQGEREADFINIIVFRKQAHNVNNYLSKGKLAGVDGRVQSRSYENQEGRRIFVTEVVADSVQFIEPKMQMVVNKMITTNNNQELSKDKTDNKAMNRLEITRLQTLMVQLILVMMIYHFNSTNLEVRCSYDWLDKTAQKIIRFTYFQNEKLFKVFAYCLMKASHKEHTQLVGRRVVHLQKANSSLVESEQAKNYVLKNPPLETT